MEKNKQAYIISEKVEVWEMVGLKYINSKEDLEALSKEELVILAGRLINDFMDRTYTRDAMRAMFDKVMTLWRNRDSEKVWVPKYSELGQMFEDFMFELNHRKESWKS